MSSTIRINIDDRDAGKSLKYFTSLSLEEIRRDRKGIYRAPEQRVAFKIPAKETALVHLD